MPFLQYHEYHSSATTTTTTTITTNNNNRNYNTTATTNSTITKTTSIMEKDIMLEKKTNHNRIIKMLAKVLRRNEEKKGCLCLNKLFNECTRINSHRQLWRLRANRTKINVRQGTWANECRPQRG